MTEAFTDVDRSALLAERAEAEAQLRAAEATLGIPPPAVAGDDRPATSERSSLMKSGASSRMCFRLANPAPASSIARRTPSARTRRKASLSAS